MQKSLFLMVISAALITTIGCSKKIESFPELDKILDVTETKQKERTEEWFAQQDEITTNVLKACIIYFDEKGKKTGGAYEDQVYNDIYSKFNEIPDCLNARKGEILKMGKTKMLLSQDQLKSIETELGKPETVEHVNKIAQDVANKLNEKDDNNSSAAKDLGSAYLYENDVSTGTYDDPMKAKN